MRGIKELALVSTSIILALSPVCLAEQRTRQTKTDAQQSSLKQDPPRITSNAPAVTFDVAEIAEKMSPSVVNIQASVGPVPGPIGSGIIIDKKGLIVTNLHVISLSDQDQRDGARKVVLAPNISVVLPDGRTESASVKGYDEATDIALLEVNPGKEPLPVARLGDSDKMRVGDWVVAIGSPFGLDHTVTLGIISGKGRSGIEGDFDDFLQTDAAINPGNSGGPLVNINGEVIGINTLIIVRGQGLGFAIPINILKDILPQLRERGRVVRGYLGIKTYDTNPFMRNRLGLPPEVKGGVLVDTVARGTPGARAGLRKGDIITTIDDVAVTSAGQFNRTVAFKPPGTKVNLKIYRDNREYPITVEIEADKGKRQE